MKTSIVMRMTAGVFALGMMSVATSEARHENPLVKMTHRAQDHAEDLRYEFKRHYRHSGGYRHLICDVDVILEELEHVDRLARNVCHDSLRHIRRNLLEVDERAHHLSDVVRGIECGRYGGRIDCDTRKAKELIACLKETVCEMEEFVDDEMRRHGGHYDRGYRHRDVGPRGSSWSWSWNSGGGREVRGEDVLREILLRLGSR
ncbi:MAG: hypothetical protein AAF591_02135 [Verrucomicrobiota bacterium]